MQYCLEVLPFTEKFVSPSGIDKSALFSMTKGRARARMVKVVNSDVMSMRGQWKAG
jgi:hypothetical protein